MIEIVTNLKDFLEATLFIGAVLVWLYIANR